MNTPREMIETFALMMKGKVGGGYHAALLKHGKEFNGAIELPAEVEPGELGDCYAGRAVIDAHMRGDDTLTYFEGEAAAADLGIPIGHGWIVRDGEVIDPVWGPGDHEYFGVEIPAERLRRFILEREVWGPYLGDPGGYLRELEED